MWRFFKYQGCIFSQRSHSVRWFVFLSKQYLCNWEEFDSLMAVLHENDPDANSASVARVEEKFIRFSPLNQKEEALTPESSSISFNQWQLIIFSSPRNCRLCFWINVYCFIFIPSFSFNIIMINPNSSLFFSLILLHRLSTDLFLLAAKSTRFHFQSKSISLCYLHVSRAICFDSRQQKQRDDVKEKKKIWKGDRSWRIKVA